MGPHNSRATSYEEMNPNLGGQDGAVAVSLVLSRLVPRSESQLSASWRRGEWVQVCNSCRVKTICIVFTLQGLRTCTHSPHHPLIRRPIDSEALVY